MTGMKKIDFRKLMNEKFPCDMCGIKIPVKEFSEYVINGQIFLICPRCKAIMDM